MAKPDCVVMQPMTVVKLGGSLLTLPDLACRIRLLLVEHVDNPIVLVGGGAAADAVRRDAETRDLDDDAAHHLAITAMDTNTQTVVAMDDRFTLTSANATNVPAGHEGSIVFLNATQTLANLEDPLPTDQRLRRSWDVTSDSIAAWIAIQLRIPHLVLLKSADPSSPAADRDETLRRLCTSGRVDREFPLIAGDLTSLRWCNLRSPSPQLTSIW